MRLVDGAPVTLQKKKDYWKIGSTTRIIGHRDERVDWKGRAGRGMRNLVDFYRHLPFAI